MYKLVLMRHGESQWNLENRFTGWTDIDLTEAGRDQARRAGELLKEKGYVFDVAFTSVLKRAIMMERTGRRTVPQIYIGDTHVGGFDDLSALDRDGKLLPLLNG